MFEKKKDAKELAKEAKQSTRKGERDIEKELRYVEREEKKLIADIKKTAKTGNQQATKTLAKQLVNLRNNKERLMAAKGQISSIGMQTTLMATQATMVKQLGNVTGVMQKMNKEVSPEEMAKVMQQFTVANEKMGLSEEMLDDALTDAFDGDGVEEEADAYVNQVLDSIGVDMTSQLNGVTAPTGRPAARMQQPAAAAQDESSLDAEAEALLKQLQAL